MIIGKNLSCQLGLDARGGNPTMKWPSRGAETPFKDTALGQQQTCFIQDSQKIEAETDGMSRTLDAKHGKADSHHTAKNVKTLSGKEQKQLKKSVKSQQNIV